MKIKFDRNELSGAFGDIGTDLPLIAALIIVSHLSSANVLIMFGLMQIATGIYYGMPMSVQPLKAVAVIAIAQQLSGNIILGAGLAIGIAMLLFTVTGLINWIARVIPECVVRGIQFGLGIKFVIIAITVYIHADGVSGYALAAFSFVLIIMLMGNKQFPPALPVIAIGIAYAFLFKIEPSAITKSFGFKIPVIHIPNLSDITAGFFLLAIPQIPLSIGNSILATHKLAEDYFPEKQKGVKKIASTYSVMNLINPFFGGVPVCHGSGGMAGHYTFGGRTGGSVVIYGGLYLILGLLFSSGFDKVVQVFPLPMLGIILFFEGFALTKLIKKLPTKTDLLIALLVGIICILKYGFVIGLVFGTVIYYTVKRFSREKRYGQS